MIKIPSFFRYFIMIAVFTAATAAVSVLAQDGGYEGLITAPPKPGESPLPPPGYSGVVPGYVAPPATAMPGQTKPFKVKSADDIKLLSTIHGGKKPAESKEVELKNVAVSDAVRNAFQGPRIQGMLIPEYSAKTYIDQVMSAVNDKDISLTERKENARIAHQMLLKKAEMYQSRRNVPEHLYRQAGMPDVYIQGKREALNGAMNRLDKAMKELKKYQ